MPLLPPFFEDAAPPPPPPPPPPSPPPRAGLAPGGVWYDGLTATPERQARRERGGRVEGQWSRPSQEWSSHRPHRRSYTTLTAAAPQGRRAGAAAPRSIEAGQGWRADLPSSQGELTRRTASCVCRAACPGHQRIWHAVARQGPRADFSCPAAMLVSSTSSLSSGSVQPPASGVPPQTEARVQQAEGERGWKHARLSRHCCQALGSGWNRAGCCCHAQERVQAKGQAHMVCRHPRTTAPARTPTACGGAPGRRSTRRRGRRPAPRRPAGAEANACTTCRKAARCPAGARTLPLAKRRVGGVYSESI